MDAQISPNAIVIDTGSYTTKIGFAGDNEPQSIVETVTGTIDNDDNKNNNHNNNNNNNNKTNKFNKYLIDTSLNTTDTNTMQQIDIQIPYRTGTIYNMEALSAIWMNTIKNKLNISETQLPSIPILLSEPSYWSNTSIYSSLFTKYRQMYCQTIFEDFNSCGMYLCKDAVLASFSHGKKSSIVLDLGDSTTKCTPIYDGYVINNGCKFTKCSGQYFNKLISNKIINELNIKIQTKYLIKNQNLKLKHSYKNYLINSIINDIKENVLKVQNTQFENINLNNESIDLGNLPFIYKKNDTYEKNISKNNSPNSKKKTKQIMSNGSYNKFIKIENEISNVNVNENKECIYILPDGQKIECNEWQYFISELLFIDYYNDFNKDLEDEWIDKMYKLNASNNNIGNIGTNKTGNICYENTKQIWNNKEYKTFKFKGIASMINESLNGCDIDIKPLCCNNIIICGGQSVYKGIIERISKELSINLPYSYKHKLYFNNIPRERIFNVWLGGSILANTKYLQNMWITKYDYNEYGTNIIHRKCY